MSSHPPIAAEERTFPEVADGPLSDSCAAATVPLFDHLVGAVEQLWRYVKAEHLRSLAIDHQLVTGRLPGQVKWIGALGRSGVASDVIAIRIDRAEYLKGRTVGTRGNRQMA